MKRDYTASAYVFNEQKVLLIFHRKLQKWLPPGGHVDLNELPTEAARRETFEETGFEIMILPQENVWIESSNARSFERPYLCLIEEIPSYKNVPAHQHMDFIYIAKLKSGNANHNHREIEDMRWFTLEEVSSLSTDGIFLETKLVISNIFASGLLK